MRGTRSWTSGLLLALLPSALLLHALAARSPALVERVYSRAGYPLLVAGLARLSSLAPFSVAEWLALLLLLGLPALGWRRARRARRAGAPLRQIASAAAVSVLGLVGFLYLWFLLAWGLNHQRPPVAELSGLDARPAAVAELRALCADLVGAANRLREGRGEDAQGVMRLGAGREAALERVALGFEAAARASGWPIPAGPPARIKRPLLSPLLWRLGITGIYVPYTGEPHVNDTLPDVELPFVAAHELAHLRGFAREDEASWVGQLACARHPDADQRYAGALSMSLYALSALAKVDRAGFQTEVAARSPAVARDVAAMLAWSERFRGPVRQAAQSVNDAYLKSQGSRDGVHSYGRVVDLLLAERRARREAGAEPSAGS